MCRFIGNCSSAVAAGENYRAWLPSEIFPKYGSVAEKEKTIANRLRRATKRGKFSRAVWVFDVVLNSRQ